MALAPKGSIELPAAISVPLIKSRLVISLIMSKDNISYIATTPIYGCNGIIFEFSIIRGQYSRRSEKEEAIFSITLILSQPSMPARLHFA